MEESKDEIKDINLNLRSEEVQDILTYIPGWIIRWGITVLFAILLLAVITSYFVKYPDIISSRVTITTQNPPSRIIANSSGKITQLLVSENQYVKKNTLLAAIESGANIDDVIQLKKELSSFEKIISAPERWTSFDFTSNLVLGEMQSDYSQLLQNHAAFRFFMETNYYSQKILLLENQIEQYQALNSKLKQKKELNDKALTLAEDKYKTEKQLFDQQVTSKFDYNTSENIYFQSKSGAIDVEIPIISNEIQLSEYQKTIADLKHQYKEQEKDLTLALEESYKKMSSQLSLWEKRYLFIAPIDGQVAFFKYWSINQFVNSGEELMTIIPDSNQIVGKIFIPGAGVGKVKEGQRVKIKLDNYPYDKFGIVNGEVRSISSISRDNQYLINVHLPDKLNTSYHKTLEFKQEMQGTAEIITEDMRLIERFFNQLRSIKDNN